ncbi:MAG TPA: Ig-like domain-containing protein [Methanofastidiosum sp.]|nr:Ig-like domain-containing protein [Methanofastidiosum sp.]HPA48674.1 Ig-like domain-containing protein [Methanofastidiosum sp.]HQQ49398.1 Ig-like domain-containing protein [Methanofastidiosum sp.]
MKNKIISIVVTLLLFLTTFSSFAFAADCNYNTCYTVTYGVQQNLNLNNAFSHCFSTGSYRADTITIGPNYGTASIIAAGQQIRYTATNTAGCGTSDTITFTALKILTGNQTTPAGTIQICINIVCPPVANPDTASLCNSSCTDIYVLTNDSNYGTSPTITIVPGTVTGGTPTPSGSLINYCAPATPGTYYFDYNVTNTTTGLSDTATVTVTVNSCTTPTAPTANPDTASVCNNLCVNVSVLDNDTNYGTSPILTVVEGPTAGTAIQSGNKINYCAPATPGTYDFNYTITNGQLTSNKAKVTVTVNDCTTPTAPTANPDTASVCNNLCVNVSVLDNDTNYGTSPILTVVEGPTAGTAIQSGNKINYCAPATPGTYDFNYTITNGQLTSNKAKVTVTVNNCGQTNNPPVAVDDNYEICMNEELTVLAPGVLANDTDPEGDPLEVYEHQTDVTNPANGTLVINENGSFTYTPNEGFYGKDIFTYRAGDFDAVSERATVTITVVDCTTKERKLIPSSILYPGIDIIQITVPASGDNIILGGKVVSSLEVAPGTQSLNVQVKNKGFLTQVDAGVRLEGLPQGVSFSLEPSTQKIKAHSTGAYTLTLTVPPTTPSGTYPIKAVSYSRKGITDRVEFNLIVD